MNKILTKKNYESSYPPPQFLKDFMKQHPKAFTIQILGCRGAGKLGSEITIPMLTVILTCRKSLNFKPDPYKVNLRQQADECVTSKATSQDGD